MQTGKLRQVNSKIIPGSTGIMLLSVFSFSQIPSALAGPFPGTAAPLSAARQMAPDVGGDPSNPFSYPFLKDIAKSLARNGFPASFFLGLDSKAGPGIDLRTILLYEAGVLKSPVKLFMPQHRKKSDVPTLSISSFPENSGEMPSAAPKLDPLASFDSDSGNSVELNPAGSRKRNKKDKADKRDKSDKSDKNEDPALSLDFNHFAVDVSASNLKHESRTKPNPDLDTLAMVQPLTVEQARPASLEESGFRFWTVPQAITVPDKSANVSSTYSGSFVMMSPLGLKGVDGRMFFLTSGHAFVCSGGKAIVIDTPVARVNVEAGATAYVEIVKAGSTRVRVLEAKAGDHDVSVKYNADGKSCQTRLAAGDDFLVADHTLSEADKSIQTKAPAGTASGGDCWNKSSFSPQELVDSDKFFSIDSPQQNLEQRSAMITLRKRLK